MVDWTATTLGVLVTLVGALATALAFMVRRELDHQRERIGLLEQRVRDVEHSQGLLKPLANHMQRKMDEEAARMVL